MDNTNKTVSKMDIPGRDTRCTGMYEVFGWVENSVELLPRKINSRI